MYSSDGPPSFSSAGINSVDQQRSVLLPPIEGSINNMMAAFDIQATGDISGQLPSYGALGHGQGNSHNDLLPDTVAQTDGNFDGDKAPSFTGLGRGQGYSHNQDGTFDRGVDYADGGQTDGNFDGDKAPSFTGLDHGQGYSHNQDGTFDRGVDYADGDLPLSVGNVRPVVNSQNSGGGDLSGGTAPSIGDIEKRENSQNRVQSVDGQDASLEALEGISLVPKKFNKFYPAAYNKEN